MSKLATRNTSSINLNLGSSLAYIKHHIPRNKGRTSLCLWLYPLGLGDTHLLHKTMNFRQRFQILNS